MKKAIAAKGKFEVSKTASALKTLLEAAKSDRLSLYVAADSLKLNPLDRVLLCDAVGEVGALAFPLAFCAVVRMIICLPHRMSEGKVIAATKRFVNQYFPVDPPAQGGFVDSVVSLDLGAPNSLLTAVHRLVWEWCRHLGEGTVACRKRAFRVVSNQIRSGLLDADCLPLYQQANPVPKKKRP